MSENIYTIDEIKNRFVKIAESYPIVQAYLFGSYARQNAKKRSDVDIAVQIKENVPFSLWDLSALSLYAKKIFNKNVDIIEYDAMSESFMTQTKKDLIKIYG